MMKIMIIMNKISKLGLKKNNKRVGDLDTKNIEKVLKELKKLENLYNIKKLDISLIESREKELKNYCKNNNICYIYSFNEWIHINLDLIISDKKIKEECYINDVKYDDTIKVLDSESDNEKEKDLFTFITSEQYGEFISETISAIKEIIKKFEYEF